MPNTLSLAASILSADFAQLAIDTQRALAAGMNRIHFDVMDHHYVPNLSFGAKICQDLRNANITAPIDVHLMVENPDAYIEPFVAAGANSITFHPETSDNPAQTIRLIQQHQLQAGIAINPDQAIEIPDSIADAIDILLLMSVYPGFGGQTFIADSVERIKIAHQLIAQQTQHICLGIDGGINLNTIQPCIAAGIEYAVIGSALFGAEDYSQFVSQIREA